MEDCNGVVAPEDPKPESEKVDEIDEGMKEQIAATSQPVHRDLKGKEKEVIPAVDVEDDKEEEQKRHLNVVFIGHVDAGKSTTGGQILFLSGQVDDRTIQKYEKEAKDKSRES
ncbi:hypothetical protein CRG98_001767, partial [Punica granatum]